jgi:hypothetical protein
MAGCPSSSLTLAPSYTVPGTSGFIREPVQLCQGTFLFWYPENLRTAIEERHMGGLCLVIVPGEVAVNLESPDKFCPMILTVPAASTISDDFEKMRDVLNQALLQLVKES